MMVEDGPRRTLRFMHSTLRNDAELAHRSELLIVSAALIAFLGSVFIGQLYPLERYHSLIPVLIGAVSSAIIALAIIRWSALLHIATAVLSIGLGFALLRVCWLEQGLSNITLIWFPLLSGAVTHMVSRRLAVMNGAFYASLVVLLFAFGPKVEGVPTMEALVRTFAVLGGIVFATTLAMRYEFIRLRTIALAERVTEKQRLANIVLAKAKAEADRANAAKTDFLATVSHELRTPLNGVLGSASLLLETNISTENRELIQSIHTASEQLQAMIGDILDLSKIEAGQVILEENPFSLSGVLDDICTITAPVARKKELSLLYKLPPSVPDTLVGDKIRLRQVLLNLVHNALKFTNNGSIIVEVHPITVGAGSTRLRFDVRDTGIGMTQETLRTLFEPFSQGVGVDSAHGGTGLGLAICRRLIEAMGGTIAADSEVEHGSIFWFELDLTIHQEQQAPLSPLADYKAAIYLTDRHHRDALAHHLRSFQMDVSIVTGPSDAVMADSDLVITSPMGLDHSAIPIPNAPRLLLGEPTSTISSDQTFLRPPVRRQKLHRAVSIALGIIEAPSVDTTDDSQPRRMAFSAKVLVVDDNEINRQVLRRMLIHLGAEVDLADDYSKSNALLASNTYDLILMDLHMPKTDGFAATRHIHQTIESPPPIIAVTASSIVGQKERCLDAGMSDYLPKPVNLDALAALMEKWIATSNPCPPSSGTDQAVSNANCILDTEVITQLLRSDAGGLDRNLGARLIELFVADLDLRSNHITTEHPELVASAHRLRSSAAILGLGPLSAAFGSIEEAGRNNSQDDEAISRAQQLIPVSRKALIDWSSLHLT